MSHERESAGGEIPGTGEGGRRRFWLRATGVAAGLLVLLYLAGVVLLRSLLDPAAVAAWLEPRAEAALAREVEIDEARLLLFPRLGAELGGIEVGGPPGFDGEEPLARIEGIRLQVAYLPLFRRQLRVDEITVAGPSLRLRVDARGRTNFGDLARQGEEEPDETDVEGGGAGGPPVELAVRDFRVTDGRLSYASVPDSTELELTSVEARASLTGRPAGSGEAAAPEAVEEGRWTVSVRAAAEETRLRHPVLGDGAHPFRGVRLEAEARAGGELDWIEIEEGSLVLEEARLALTGRAEALKEPVRRVDLELSAEALEVSRLLPFLPPDVEERLPGPPEGRITVAMTLRGELGPERRPELRGRVSLTGGGMTGPDGVRLAEGVSGVLFLVEEGVEVRELSGRVLGGTFAADAAVGGEAPFPLRADVKASLQLERLGAAVTLPDGVELSGRSEVDVRLRAPLEAAHELELDGVLDLQGLRLVHPRLGVPVEVDEARLLLEGRRARWEEVALGVGPDRVAASGSLDDLPALLAPEGEGRAGLRLRLEATHLDLDRALPPRGDTAVTYGILAFARLGGRDLDGRSPEEVARAEGFARPASLPVVGEAIFAFDTLRSAPYVLTPARAHLEFGPELLRLTEIDAGLFGGRIAGEVRLGLGLEPLQPFDLRLSASGVAAREFLAAMTPLGRRVGGSLGLELEVGGVLDTLLLPDPASVSGSGRTTVEEGRLAETRVTSLLARSLARPALATPGVRRWNAPFSLEGPVLRFEEARLALDDGELGYGGSVGLDGALDLALRLAFSADDLDRGALEGTGFAEALADLGGTGTGRLGLGLRLRGTLDAPRLLPDASLATGDLRAAFESGARERAERIREEAEERAGELRDSARARLDALGETATERLEEERRPPEERGRREVEEAREELEERGRGLLRGLLGRERGDEPPDTAEVPGDTLPGDTLPVGAGEDRSDTLPDSIPPDTSSVEGSASLPRTGSKTPHPRKDGSLPRSRPGP